MVDKTLFRVIYLRQRRRRYMFLPVFVCLSVCLWARLLKKVCMIWMKCCVSTDVGTRMNWLTFEPDPDYSPDAGTGVLSPISYALQRGILLHRGNFTYKYWAAAMSGFTLVLAIASRRNNFVGNTCALQSALIVCVCNDATMLRYLLTLQHYVTRNLAIANRSRDSCTHNTSRASIVTTWLWNLG